MLLKGGSRSMRTWWGIMFRCLQRLFRAGNCSRESPIEIFRSAHFSKRPEECAVEGITKHDKCIGWKESREIQNKSTGCMQVSALFDYLTSSVWFLHTWCDVMWCDVMWCRRFYLNASGLHREMFSSTYRYVIGEPIKSSALCDPIAK